MAGLRLGGHRVTRTAYRPGPWRAAEWAVAGCGVLSAVLPLSNAGFDAAEPNPSVYPPSRPTLPPVPAAAILLAGAAGFLSPPPAQPVRPAVPAQRTEETERSPSARSPSGTRTRPHPSCGTWT